MVSEEIDFGLFVWDSRKGKGQQRKRSTRVSDRCATGEHRAVHNRRLIIPIALKERKYSDVGEHAAEETKGKR